jgi:hypothetical protein
MDEKQQAHFLKLLGEELGSNASPSDYPGSTIAWLLDMHMHLCDLPEWRWRWMDDVLDTRIEVKGEKVEVFGYVVWGNDETSEQWTDPFQAIFIRDSEERIVEYELLFCDDTYPSQPYTLSRRRQPTAEIDWSYRFAWKNQNID